MRYRILSFLIVLIGLSLMLVGQQSAPQPVSAHDPHGCPDDIVDVPAIDHHIDHADVIADKYTFDEIMDEGQTLFEANFNICDGQGRPSSTGTGAHRDSFNQPDFSRTSAPESNSCAGCHNVPNSGGGGDIVANVFVLAQASDPVVTVLDDRFFNERHTIGMFGSGPIEMLSREMTAELLAIREAAFTEAAESGSSVRVELVAKGVHFGYITVYPDQSYDPSEIEGVDPDLIIKPFHQAGVVISLREFTVNAMNHHHGMQADERFDLHIGKHEDYDEDGVAHELTIGDITVVTIWQAGIDTPTQVLPEDEVERDAILQGEMLFAEVGCTTCHIPEFQLESRFFVEPNPYNPDGTFSDTDQAYSFDMTEQGDGVRLERDGDGAIIRPFTDLKRHNLCDAPEVEDAIRFYCNEKLDQDRPDQDGRPGREFFLTRKLWDIGSSPSFGHRGDITTIYESIMYHGGEARESRDAYMALSQEQKLAIVKFLYSLQVVLAE